MFNEDRPGDVDKTKRDPIERHSNRYVRKYVCSLYLDGMYRTLSALGQLENIQNTP